MGHRVLAWALVLPACGFQPGQLRGDGGSDTGSSADARRDAPTDTTPAQAARRKPLTIHGSSITGSLTDFPVWIDLTDADIAARARADGTDIFFTAADGTTRLDREVQSWQGGRLRAWVRVPSLAQGTDTRIYVEYGDVAKANAPSPTGVFRASFLAVWHLDDALTSATITDATGTHAGTATQLTAAASTTGQLGGAIQFDGSGSSQIAFVNPLSGNSPHTISAWVNQSTTTHLSAVLVVGEPNTDHARFLYGSSGINGAGIGIGQYSDDFYPAGQDIEGLGWTHLVWTCEGGNKKSHFYKNGTEIGTGWTANNAPNTSGMTGLIGFAPETAYGPDNGMLGGIDEVRIASVARSPGWIATEFANQHAPSAFYAVGAEEPAP